MPDARVDLRELRVRSLFSSYYFSKVVLKYSELTDYFHKVEMDEFLDRWAAGTTKQAIVWSRGFFKSTCFTISSSIWVVLPVTANDSDYAIDGIGIPEEIWFERVKLHNQNACQLVAFETAPNARKKVAKIKEHFERNSLFRSLFPEIAYHKQTCKPWTNEILKIPQDPNLPQHEEGTFEAIGVGGALQSRHYDIVWEDDLVGEEARKSPTVMQDTIGWHTRLHGAFIDATRQVRFVVGNVWGFDDLNSYIKANEPEFHFHIRSSWSIDPETGKEVATFPVDGEGKTRYTIEALEKIRANMRASDFACQYQNMPTLESDREINLSAVHIYKIVDGKVVCNCGATFYPETLRHFLHYDPYNAKGPASDSCPAIVVVATAWDKHVFLMDTFTAKGSYERIFDRIFEMNERWRPCVFTFEDVANQNMCHFHILKIQQTEEHKKKFKRMMPRIVGIPSCHDTERRVRDHLMPLIHDGKFSIRADQLSVRSQLETYPGKVSGHDYDLLSALSQGVTPPKKGSNIVWTFPYSDEVIKERSGSDAQMIAELKKHYTRMRA